MPDPSLPAEVARRRTFAIISHSDAGKTTLTEKFLLWGGAIQLAGSMRARRNQRATTSDCLELEKERGISVSSALLQFEYGGCAVNLLDTPRRKDVSEDTYRVLTAVDSVIVASDPATGRPVRLACPRKLHKWALDYSVTRQRPELERHEVSAHEVNALARAAGRWEK